MELNDQVKPALDNLAKDLHFDLLGELIKIVTSQELKSALEAVHKKYNKGFEMFKMNAPDIPDFLSVPVKEAMDRLFKTFEDSIYKLYAEL